MDPLKIGEKVHLPSEKEYDSKRAYALATDIFSVAFKNHLSNFGSITNFRRVVETGVPLAVDYIAQEDLDNLLDLLSSPSGRQIFIDPDGLVAKGEHLHMAREQTRMSIETAESTIDAASIVFAHAVLDATLFEYCKTCAIVAPNDWTPLIENRKVAFSDMRKLTHFEVQTRLIENYLVQLEKESLIEKADILHQITALGDTIRPLHNYEYSMTRLGEIDTRRHGFIHKLGFKNKAGEVKSDIRYLLDTGFYFLSIVNQKYGLKIDPSK